MQNLDKPIFIVGPARSGTTMLGRIIAQHSQVAHWEEPNNIWSYRSQRNWDRRLPAELPTGVGRYIVRRFLEYMQEQGPEKLRFSEKTPSNCFRVSFMHALFPNAKFIYLVRDGRDVIASAYERWTGKTDYVALWKRLERREVLTFPQLLTGLKRLFNRKPQLWGPRFPDWEDIVKEEGIWRACTWQWIQSVTYAEEAFQFVPHLKVHFENLVTSPEEETRRILDFVELDQHKSLSLFATNYVDPTAVGRGLDLFGKMEMKERTNEIVREVVLEILERHEYVHV